LQEAFHHLSYAPSPFIFIFVFEVGSH
jgi:hypothetical protein